ncbi:MAG: hypothetical protein M3P24_04935 [Gemmatimonadota bacterium]|nr:hypothetical protein [Gemmatimonadota bacterium]
MRSSLPMTAALLAAALAGCRPQPAVTVSGPGPDLENPPLRESVTAPRPGPGVEGVYLLTEVNGRPVPAVMETPVGCTVRILTGRMALRDGGFTATATGEETCRGTTSGPTVRRAEGSYRVSGSALRLTLAPDGPFRDVAVEVQILSDSALAVTRVTAGETSRALSLRLRKQQTP